MRDQWYCSNRFLCQQASVEAWIRSRPEGGNWGFSERVIYLRKRNDCRGMLPGGAAASTCDPG